MAIAAHAWQDIGSDVIKIEENVAGIAMLGIGQQIDVIPLTVACAQKAYHRSTHQLTSIPKPFSWTGLTCGAVNQPNKVEIIRHGRHLVADGVPGKEESAIAHGHENAIEASYDYNEFSANGNNPLKPVSQPRGSVHNCRPSPRTPHPGSDYATVDVLLRHQQKGDISNEVRMGRFLTRLDIDDSYP